MRRQGLCCMLSLSTIASAVAASPRFAVRVVDGETDAAVSNVIVAAIFQNAEFETDRRHLPMVFCRETGGAGDCVFRCKADDERIEFRAKKDGCYDAIGKYSYKGVEPPYAYTLPIFKMVKPIPMFVKEVSKRFGTKPGTDPEEDILRYDLMKGAWLPPHGEGEIADIEVRREFQDLGLVDNAFGAQKGIGAWRSTLKIKFLGEGNGIVTVTPRDCQLRVRTAPEEGYADECSSTNEFGRDQEYRKSFSEKDAQCFRIRCKRGEDGVMTECCYGKIYGGFRIEQHGENPGSKIGFTYYLNTNAQDRNLEYDGKHNLCDRHFDGFER